MRNELFNKLVNKVEEFDSLFVRGTVASIKRFFSHPYKIFVRKIQTKIFKNFYFLTTTNTFFGYPMIIYSFEYTQWFGGFLGGTEISLQKYLIKFLQEDGIFFDIGSHHGFYSLLAHAISPRIQVHSFEPTGTHFTILKNNTATHENIIVNNIALTDNVGEISFYESIKGKSTIEKDFFKNVSNSDDFYETKVQSTTLDRYCDEKKILPTFMKLDVEGSEFKVLNGALKALLTSSPIIAIELWSKPYDNSNHLKAVTLLRENGYSPYRIDLHGDISPIRYDELDLILSRNSASDNYIFKK